MSAFLVDSAFIWVPAISLAIPVAVILAVSRIAGSYDRKTETELTAERFDDQGRPK